MAHAHISMRDLVLSAEEAAILVDDINQTEHQLSTAIAETNTTADVTAIYQDSRAIERDFDNAEVLALSDIVTTLGTSIMGQVTVVDYKPTIPSNESISDHVVNGWKKIVALLKRAWMFLTNFFKRIFSYRDYLRHKCSVLRSNIATLSEEPLTEKPIIDVPMRDGKIFTTQGKKLIDTASFQAVMKDIVISVRKLFQQGPPAITYLGDKFMDCMSAIKVDSTSDELQEVVAKNLLDALWRYFSAFGIKDFRRDSVDSHLTNTFTALSEPIAGSARVSFTWGTAMNEFFLVRKTEQKFSYVIRDLSLARCHVVQERELTPSNHMTMPAFKVPGMLAAIKEVEDGLKVADELEKSFDHKMHDFSEKFGQIAEKVGKQFDGDGGASNEARTVFNAMLNLPVLYANLATQPLTDLTKRTLGTFEAILRMVEASTKMYHRKEGSQDYKPAGM